MFSFLAYFQYAYICRRFVWCLVYCYYFPSCSFMASSIAYDPRTSVTEGFFLGPDLAPRGRAWSPFSLVFHKEIDFIAIYGGLRGRCWIEGRGSERGVAKRGRAKGGGVSRVPSPSEKPEKTGKPEKSRKNWEKAGKRISKHQSMSNWKYAQVSYAPQRLSSFFNFSSNFSNRQLKVKKSNSRIKYLVIFSWLFFLISRWKHENHSLVSSV